MLSIFRLTGRLVLVALAAGCTFADRPLNKAQVTYENRLRNTTRAAVSADVVPPQAGPPRPLQREQEVRAATSTRPTSAPARGDNGVFVGLALSGGGSRAANFSAACMLQLQRVGLLQHVKYISSVSGGSLTAAYYCLSGPEWNPQALQKNLTHPFATDLVEQVLLPWNMVALLFSDYDRTDLLAASFTRVLYSRNGKALYFRDLRPDRPRLLINATDLQSGRRFVFCNETFDKLNADLSSYPIANAVAASSAVPVLLHPLTLRDFSTAFPEYLHLIDGGVVDNLGIQTLIETYDAQVQSAEHEKLPDPYPNGAVFVVIDSHTRYNAELSSRGDVGIISSLKAGAGLSTTELLHRASSATLAELIVNNSPDEVTARDIRDQIDRLDRDGYVELTDRHRRPVRVVYISLTQVSSLHRLPFEGFNESLSSIETYFNIDPLEAYHLYQAAELLVSEKFEPPLRKIVQTLSP